MRKKKPTTEEIILGIRSSDGYIANYIYKNVFPMVKGYILHNSGDETQAADLFQEAYISLHRKCAQIDICIDCEFSTYFYSYCKNLWLKELSKRKRHNDKIKIVEERKETYGDPEKEIQDQEEHLLFLEHFYLLKKNCQKILTLYFNKVNFNIIAKKLGFINANQARKQKYKCVKMLTDAIKKDARYKELKGGERA